MQLSEMIDNLINKKDKFDYIVKLHWSNKAKN